MVFIARILLFLQIVVLAVAAGAVIAFFGIILIATLLGDTNMDGGLAMGAVGFGPIGAVAGAILGAWLAWFALKRISDSTILVGGYGLMAFAALCVGGWFLIEELTDGNPYPADAEPVVLIEWRLPAKANEKLVVENYRHMMRSSYKNWILTTAWQMPRSREKNGQTILRFRANIRWRVTGRKFQLWVAPNHDDRITVALDLAKDPQASPDYGPWRKVQNAAGHAYRTRIIRR